MRRILLLEQMSAQLPSGDKWLDPFESSYLAGLHLEKRRSDWRLGRWTAKNAIAQLLGLPHDHCALSAIHIRSDPGEAPFAWVGNPPRRIPISISHSSGSAICAAPCPASPVGCDLERVESRSRAFLADYFTRAEQAEIAGLPPENRALAATLCWSAKESVLKAIGIGLGIDTRAVSIMLPEIAALFGKSWRPLTACFHGSVLCGWSQYRNGLIRTLISAPPPQPPIPEVEPVLDNVVRFE